MISVFEVVLIEKVDDSRVRVFLNYLEGDGFIKSGLNFYLKYEEKIPSIGDRYILSLQPELT